MHAFNIVTGTMLEHDDPGGPNHPPFAHARRGQEGPDGPEPRGPPPATEELAVGLPFDHDGNPRTRKISVESFYRRLGLPVVSENLIRKELGWPKRTKY